MPYTIIREGPAGSGMLQLWVEQPDDSSPTMTIGRRRTSSTCFPRGEVPSGYLPVLRAYDYAGDEVTLVHADDVRLRHMSIFDVLVNNADRKGGHIYRAWTATSTAWTTEVSLHVDDKLRTVLWGWAGKPIDDELAGSRRRTRRGVVRPAVATRCARISPPMRWPRWSPRRGDAGEAGDAHAGPAAADPVARVLRWQP